MTSGTKAQKNVYMEKPSEAFSVLVIQKSWLAKNTSGACERKEDTYTNSKMYLF